MKSIQFLLFILVAGFMFSCASSKSHGSSHTCPAYTSINAENFNN